MVPGSPPGNATLTSTGRATATSTWGVGSADDLTGWRRWLEVYLRLRQRYNRRTAWHLLRVSQRHGVRLSGERTNAQQRRLTRRRLQMIEHNRQLHQQYPDD